MAEAADLFPGFESRVFDTGEAAIFARIGGSGPLLMLLHGFPQTHATWHRIAPALARHFTVVLPDLRGYGRSSCPPAGAGHEAYGKRRMAGDLVHILAALDAPGCLLVGHDRGGRVAYRMALDRPDLVRRLGIIEIVPTYEMWQRFTVEVAHKTYHWLFLAQPEPLPERLIGGAPDFFCDYTLARWSQAKDLSAFDPRALAEYRALFADPARIHAMCEDYRAGAGCDLEADRADIAAGRRIACPLHVVYGRSGFPAAAGGPLAIWRRWAEKVEGTEIDCGHFAQEENPEGVIEALLPFLRKEIA